MAGWRCPSCSTELTNQFSPFETAFAQATLPSASGNKDVTAVIPGTNKAEHMIDNLGAGRGRLPDAAQRRKMVEFFQQL